MRMQSAWRLPIFGPKIICESAAEGCFLMASVMSDDHILRLSPVS